MDQTTFNQVMAHHAHDQILTDDLEGDGVVVKEGRNPLCGDSARVFIDDQHRKIAVKVKSEGCMVCRASANILSAELHNKDLETLGTVSNFVLGSFKGESRESYPGMSESIAALMWLRRFPVRKKCALISWRALSEAVTEIKQRRTEKCPSGYLSSQPIN